MLSQERWERIKAILEGAGAVAQQTGPRGFVEVGQPVKGLTEEHAFA